MRGGHPLAGGRPEWLRKCAQCLACIHLCPERAIQVGSRTVHRRRCHHPELPLADLIAQKKPPDDLP